MADDMGLGKTIQVISLILKLKEEDKLNELCAGCLSNNSCGKLAKGMCKICAIFNYCIFTTAANVSWKLQDADIIITTYGLLRNEIEILKINIGT